MIEYDGEILDISKDIVSDRELNIFYSYRGLVHNRNDPAVIILYKNEGPMGPPNNYNMSSGYYYLYGEEHNRQSVRNGMCIYRTDDTNHLICHRIEMAKIEDFIGAKNVV